MKHRILTMAAAMAAITAATLATGGASAQAVGQAANNPNPGCFQIQNLTNDTLHRQNQTGTFGFPSAIGAGMMTQPSCAKSGDTATYLDPGGAAFSLTVLPNGDGTVSGGHSRFTGSNIAVFTN